MLRSFKKKAEAAFRKGRSQKFPSDETLQPTTIESIPPPSTESSAVSVRSSLRDLVPPDIEELLQAQPSESETEVELQPEPSPEPETAPAAQEPDPYASKYVPFAEASMLRGNILSQPASYYGRVNASIMQGFGGDDESIWLVDDEETDEEDKNADEEQPEQDETNVVSNKEVTSDLEQKDIQNSGSGVDARATEDTHVEKTEVPEPEAEPGVVSLSTKAEDIMPPTLKPGYAPISASILAGFDLEETPQTQPSSETEPQPSSEQEPTTEQQDNLNPYVALLEKQNHSMTITYLRHLNQTEGQDAADEFSFGQRYQVNGSNIVVSRQRLPREHLSGHQECKICTVTKAVDQFPRFTVTASCTHPPPDMSRMRQLLHQIRLGEQDVDRGPVRRVQSIPRLCGHPTIRRRHHFSKVYTSPESLDAANGSRYEQLAMRAAMSQSPNFIWCTSPCGSGQIHDPSSPLVTCLHCGHKSCFTHQISWHENLTCAQYDSLLADPESFEISNDDATRALVRDTLAHDKTESEKREARQSEEVERVRKAADMARKIIARRRKEDERSLEVVRKVAKPCPGCGWAIQKFDGW
ncbi:ring finger domain-containing protein [Pochonia chlamydosporia 170]|uniref:RBR-type E3 ubiquitin transferase n=1 Tax=Pochonia chlamydosporia 170 TaxID=1380566 RepID=A0A179G5S8_METCM|nr:ring finger domain-containing protein [Pochonia chlamydosporia 170]OAQ73184.2 ring finger domain-containing protein [Pochonia chlamydosporia 170]